MSKLPRVAVLGATGAVGQEFIRLFEERDFQFASLKLLASKRSAGKKVLVKGKEYTVEEAKPESLKISTLLSLPAEASARPWLRKLPNGAP